MITEGIIMQRVGGGVVTTTTNILHLGDMTSDNTLQLTLPSGKPNSYYIL